MIARAKEDPTTSIIAITALVLLAGALAFMLLATPPAAPTTAERIDAENKIKLETATARKSLAEAQTLNAKLTWPGNADQITPAVLGMATKAAQARGLRLVSLRPQRIDEKSVPPMLPFLAVVEGPYTATLAFAKDMEAPAHRLAVSLVQMTASDAASDKVTASIGLAAFMQPDRAPEQVEEKKETTNA